MYCTSIDVESRNHALLDSADPTEMTNSIVKAQGIVDGMLRKLYPVPLSIVPDIILGISADLAASFLLSDLVGNAGRNEEPTQADSLYKKAMDLLKMINEGDLVLDVVSQVGVEETSVLKQARCTTYASTSKFDRGIDTTLPSTYPHWRTI